MAPHELQPVDGSVPILPGNGYLVPIDQSLFWLGIACSDDWVLEAEARSHILCTKLSHGLHNNDNEHGARKCVAFLMPAHDQTFECVQRSEIYHLHDESLEVATNGIADQVPGKFDAFLSACEVWRVSLQEDDGEALMYWTRILGLKANEPATMDEGFKQLIDEEDIEPITTEDHSLAMSLSRAEELEEEARWRQEESDRHFAEAVEVEYEEGKKEEKQQVCDVDQKNGEVIYNASLPTPPSSQRPSTQLAEDNKDLQILFSISKKRTARELKSVQRKAKRVKTKAVTEKWIQKINPMVTDEFESGSYESNEDVDGESKYLSILERNRVQRGILDDLRLGGNAEDFEGRQVTAVTGFSGLHPVHLSLFESNMNGETDGETDGESEYSKEEEEEEKDDDANDDDENYVEEDDESSEKYDGYGDEDGDGDENDDVSSEVSASAYLGDSQSIVDAQLSSVSSSSCASSVHSTATDKPEYLQVEQSRPQSFSNCDSEKASNDKDSVILAIGQESQRTMFSLLKSLIVEHSPVLTEMVQRQDREDVISNDILSSVLPADFAAVQSHISSGDFTPALVENPSVGPEEFLIQPGWLGPADRTRFVSFYLLGDEINPIGNPSTDALKQGSTLSRLGRLLILGMKFEIKGFVNAVIEKLQYGFPFGYYCLDFLTFARNVLDELRKIDGGPALATVVAQMNDWIAKVLGSQQTELAMDRSVVGNIYWNIIEKNPEMEVRLDGGRAKAWVGG
ncbi:MAG: hypothetical protein Q9160_002132 [Pyrenula sp. 1 TL-2023]